MKSIPMLAVNQLTEQETRYRLKSPLLFGALQSLNPETRVELLDLAPANPSLLDYFSPFHCKLFLPGYREQLLALRVDDEIPEQSLPDKFSEGISLTSGNTALNLLLLWDLPNYLDQKVLSGLSVYLSQFCTRQSILHCYIHTRQSMPALPGDYRLTPEHTVMVEMSAPWTAASPMYHQALLNKIFSPFQVQRGMLLANGLQEYLLHPS